MISTCKTTSPSSSSTQKSSSPTQKSSSPTQKSSSPTPTQKSPTPTQKSSSSSPTQKSSSPTQKSSPSKSDKENRQFESVKCFVRELSNFFNTNLSLRLYNHLLSKTTCEHRTPMMKHIKLFKNFAIRNRAQILSSNTALVDPIVRYSDRVKIDFSVIFRDVELEDSAAETQEILFEHLLVLSMVLDPQSGAAEVLRKRKKERPLPPMLESLFEEHDFLKDMVDKVEKHVTPGANPMEAMTSMMTSGVLQDIVAGMQQKIDDGSLDIQKLMTSVQTMTQALPPEQLAALQPMMSAAAPPTPVHMPAPVKTSKHVVRGGKKKRKKKRQKSKM